MRRKRNARGRRPGVQLDVAALERQLRRRHRIHVPDPSLDQRWKRLRP